MDDTMIMFLKTLEKFEKTLEKFEGKFDWLLKEWHEGKCQRLRCLPECEKIFVSNKDFEHRSKKAIQDYVVNGADKFNKFVKILKNLAWIAPTVIMVLFYINQVK